MTESKGDRVGGHLWETPDASVSTRVAIGDTLCGDGERNGLDGACPRGSGCVQWFVCVRGSVKTTIWWLGETSGVTLEFKVCFGLIYNRIKLAVEST